MNKIKIVYVIDYIVMDKAGTEKQLLGLIQRLDRNRFEPWLVCLRRTPWTDSHPLPCSYLILEYRGIIKWNFPLILWQFAKFIQDQRFDIVQTFFEDSIFVAFLAVFFSGTKPSFITSRRDIGLGRSHPWYHFIFKGILPAINRRTHSVAVNGQNVKKFVMENERLQADKIRVIYNGIDVTAPTGHQPEIFQTQPADVWIGITANLNPIKRIDLFLNAFALLKGQCGQRKVRAVVMGEGSEKEKMIALAKRLKIEEDVFFLGSVGNVEDYLQHLDLAVLCSDREGFSNAILEYMTRSLPIVATSVGGNTELVDLTNGICVPTGDTEALAQALKTLVLDPGLRKMLGKNSREKVEKNFSWNKSIQEWQKLYEDMVPNALTTVLDVSSVSENEFGLMAEDWNRLLNASLVNHPFLTWEWMHGWWQNFKSGKQLLLLAVRKDHRLVGLAPFYIHRTHSLGNMKTLKLFSSDELYPDYLDLIAEKGFEDPVVQAVGQYLGKNSKLWDRMQLDHVLQDSTVMKLETIFSLKCKMGSDPSSQCPYLKTEGSYDDYMKKQFNRKRRYNLERQVKILMEDHGCVLKKITEPDSLERAIDHMFDLHQKRASVKQIKSSFALAKVKAFHLGFSRWALQKGLLNFYFIFKGEKPVSVAYGFRYAGKIYFYQSGMDPEWQKLSAGTVLLTLLIQEAFGNGVAEFDFLKGDEEYKKSWATQERTVYCLQIFNANFKGQLAYGAYWAKSLLKRSMVHSGTVYPVENLVSRRRWFVKTILSFILYYSGIVWGFVYLKRMVGKSSIKILGYHGISDEFSALDLFMGG